MNRLTAVIRAALFIAVGGLSAGAALHLWSVNRCEPLGDADKARLISYVRGKYKLGSNADIDVADSGAVFGSCFRKLVFASLSGRQFRAGLFASPDFRFLTSDLLDARPDPKEELRRRQETAAALVHGDLPARGTAKAPVTLAIFSDFQCPYCARMANSLNSLAASEGDRLRIVYHHFPLSIHHWARQAAEAAACAQRQSDAAFWSLHDFLFAHQHDLSPDNLTGRLADWARTAPELDRQKFASCVSAESASGHVEQDMVLGKELGVHATPTIFLNGEPVDNSSPEELRASIRRAAGAR